MSLRNKIYIGIDGGGSTSRLVAVDANNNIIARKVSGATNLASMPEEKVYKHINELLSAININDCVSLCIGTAGAGVQRNIDVMQDIIRSIGYKGILEVVTDAIIALQAETKGEAGIVIISGTGSIGYSVDENGNTSRCGGWGSLIDDGGSGYKIGMDAIHYAFKDFDGRGIKTILTSQILEYFKMKDMYELLAFVYSSEFNKTKISKLSRLVQKAAKAKDEAALNIEKEAARDLALIAKTLIKNNNLTNHYVVLSGGIILNNRNIQKKMSDEILESYPDIKIVKQKEPAEIGAVYMARRNDYEKSVKRLDCGKLY